MVCTRQSSVHAAHHTHLPDTVDDDIDAVVFVCAILSQVYPSIPGGHCIHNMCPCAWHKHVQTLLLAVSSLLLYISTNQC